MIDKFVISRPKPNHVISRQARRKAVIQYGNLAKILRDPAPVPDQDPGFAGVTTSNESKND
jgi:hypothetical protein